MAENYENKYLGEEGLKALWQKILDLKQEQDDKIDELSSSAQSDWNQNDETAANYVKNRTHYENFVNETTILETQEYKIEYQGLNDGLNILVDANVTLDTNKKYKVLFNDIEYICDVKYIKDSYSSNSGLYLGNLLYHYNIFHSSAVNSENMDTGEPFLIVIDNTNYLRVRVQNAQYQEGLTSFGLKSFDDFVIKELDEKFISYKPGQKTEGGGEIFNDYENNRASGYAHAEGYWTYALSGTAHTEGYKTIAEQYAAHAEGYQTTASGEHSHTEGKQTVAQGNQAHAEGLYAQALGNASHAEGEDTKAYSTGSHAEGKSTKSGGDGTTVGGAYTHAEGVNSIATGRGAHAEGEGSLASGDYSHAEGGGAKAIGAYSHAEGCNDYRGWQVDASGMASHAEGKGTYAKAEASHAEGSSTEALGAYAHAEGFGTSAKTESSHAEGRNTKAGETEGGNDKYAHAEGNGSMAYGEGAHAEGENTLARGKYSHAEGGGSQATGNYSHAEGCNSGDSSVTASAPGAHAEGRGTTASGDGSHAEGKLAIASGEASHAEGIETGAGVQGAHAEGMYTSVIGIGSHAEGHHTSASGYYCHAEGTYTSASGYGAHAEGRGDVNQSVVASGQGSHAEGFKTQSSGSFSHAEGERTIASGKNAHSEGGCSYLTDPNATSETYMTSYSFTDPTDTKHAILSTVAMGSGSHAEGLQTVSYGFGAHSEGYKTQAIGTSSHAEGKETIAYGPSGSHAEGSFTYAKGISAHAEGFLTEAIGDYSHAEGVSTIAAKEGQHVQGQYNLTGTYAMAIGNGDNTKRSNAMEVDWSGNAKFAGDVVAYNTSYSLANIGNEVAKLKAKKPMSIKAKGTNTNFNLPASTVTILPLTTRLAGNSLETSVTDGFRISTASDLSGKATAGGLVCPYTGTVVVSGNVYFNSTSGAAKKGAYILCQRSAVGSGYPTEEAVSQYLYEADSGQGRIDSGSTIIDVFDGDIIYLAGRSNIARYCDINGSQLNIHYLEHF